MTEDIKRIEDKLDRIESLLLKIVPVDLSKESVWKKEFEDLQKRSRRFKVAKKEG